MQHTFHKGIGIGIPIGIPTDITHKGTFLAMSCHLHQYRGRDFSKKVGCKLTSNIVGGDYLMFGKNTHFLALCFGIKLKTAYFLVEFRSF